MPSPIAGSGFLNVVILVGNALQRRLFPGEVFDVLFQLLDGLLCLVQHIQQFAILVRECADHLISALNLCRLLLTRRLNLA
jgi:hypothetical protein